MGICKSEIGGAVDAAFDSEKQVPQVQTRHNLWVRGLDLIARLCFALHESRRAKIALSLLLVMSIFSPVLARSDRIANETIKNARTSDISISSQGSWLRVSGRVIPSATYQNKVDMGFLQLRSNYYVAVQSEGTTDTLFVLLDAVPVGSSEPITVSGQIVMGTGSQQPAFYLEPGVPPNVAVANWIARIGSILIVLLFGLIALMLWVHHNDYVIASPVDAPERVTAAPRFSWYGDLGRQYGDVTVRNMACAFYATVHEARFECTHPKDLWNVSVRRLRSAQLGSVATPYGLMPSARIWFEDERGLARRATLVSNARAELDMVLRVTSMVQ